MRDRRRVRFAIGAQHARRNALLLSDERTYRDDDGRIHGRRVCVRHQVLVTNANARGDNEGEL